MKEKFIETTIGGRKCCFVASKIVAIAEKLPSEDHCKSYVWVEGNRDEYGVDEGYGSFLRRLRRIIEI